MEHARGQVVCCANDRGGRAVQGGQGAKSGVPSVRVIDDVLHVLLDDRDALLLEMLVEGGASFANVAEGATSDEGDASRGRGR